jgi:hypothetical protein
MRENERIKMPVYQILNDYYYRTNLKELDQASTCIYVEGCTYKFQVSDEYLISILPYLIILKYNDVYLKSDFNKGTLIDRKNVK